MAKARFQIIRGGAFGELLDHHHQLWLDRIKTGDGLAVVGLAATWGW
jgi:hypothetical protein